GEPDAALRIRRDDAGSVVAHAQSQLIAGSSRGNLDRAGAGVTADSVMQRVLDQGLQNEERHERALGSVVDVDGDGEAVAKACPRDVEIGFENAELFAQLYLALLAAPKDF